MRGLSDDQLPLKEDTIVEIEGTPPGDIIAAGPIELPEEIRGLR